jgi:hypothetical protein
MINTLNESPLEKMIFLQDIGFIQKCAQIIGLLKIERKITMFNRMALHCLGSPAFFDQLDTSDQAEYESLRQKLCSDCSPHKRRSPLKPFGPVLSSIQQYVGDSPVHTMVCGIAWSTTGIAVNTRQLGILTGRCKSSINGSVQALHYGTVPTGAHTLSELEGMLPLLKGSSICSGSG